MQYNPDLDSNIQSDGGLRGPAGPAKLLARQPPTPEARQAAAGGGEAQMAAEEQLLGGKRLAPEAQQAAAQAQKLLADELLLGQELLLSAEELLLAAELLTPAVRQALVAAQAIRRVTASVAQAVSTPAPAPRPGETEGGLADQLAPGTMSPTLIALVVAGVLLAVKAHAFSSTPTLADAREWLAEARERLERELATRELATGLIFSLPAAVFLCTAGLSNTQYLSGVAVLLAAWVSSTTSR